MALCPYCNVYNASGPWDEISHMEKNHMNIVVDRLVEAGIHPEELKKGEARTALEERLHDI